MDKGVMTAEAFLICSFLFLPCRVHAEYNTGKQQGEPLDSLPASRRLSKSTLDYEGKSHDIGLTLNDYEYETDEEDDTMDYYDWYEDYYEKYKSFARHAMMSEVYQPEFIIENVGLCTADTAILIFINSRLNNRPARDAIRKIFKKTFNELGIAYGFFLSKPTDVETKRRVVKENTIWGDLVVAASKEAYPQLTVKTAHLLHWVATNCPNSNYVAKVDDDVYLNVARLLRVLQAPRNYTVLGKICTNCIPFRGIGKSLGAALKTSSTVVVTRRQVPLTKFPPFAMGPAYVLTTDLVPHLLEAALQMVYFEYEDVFWTGQVVEEINEGQNVAAGSDQGSNKEKYYNINHYTNWEVRHEEVAGWRLDFRGPITSQLLNLAHQAVTVHGIDWHKQKQFVAALANL